MNKKRDLIFKSLFYKSDDYGAGVAAEVHFPPFAMSQVMVLMSPGAFGVAVIDVVVLVTGFGLNDVQAPVLPVLAVVESPCAISTIALLT